jgi:hypothetical protein
VQFFSLIHYSTVNECMKLVYFFSYIKVFTRKASQILTDPEIKFMNIKYSVNMATCFMKGNLSLSLQILHWQIFVPTKKFFFKRLMSFTYVDECDLILV